jgi:hypothetical protein
VLASLNHPNIAAIHGLHEDRGQRFLAMELVPGTPKALFSPPSIDWPFLRNVMDVMPDGSGFMTVHPPSTAALSIRVRTGK